MCIGHLNRLLINRTYTLNSIQLLRVRHALIDIVNKLENNIDWPKITSWYFSVCIGNSMICSDTVFGINTASDIGIRISRAVGQVKFETILKYHWVVFFYAKYHAQIMLLLCLLLYYCPPVWRRRPERLAQRTFTRYGLNYNLPMHNYICIILLFCGACDVIYRQNNSARN